MNKTEFNDTFDEVGRTCGLLLNDFVVCINAVTDDDEKDYLIDYNKRAFVRTLFSALEGIGFQFKRAALCFAEYNPSTFSLAEIVLLKEQTYKLNDKGETICSISKLQTLPNFLFSLRMITKSLGDRFEYSKNSQEIKNFNIALKIRHRLTHPKFEGDLKILEDEMESVVQTGVWLQKIIFDIIPKLHFAKETVEANLNN